MLARRFEQQARLHRRERHGHARPHRILTHRAGERIDAAGNIDRDDRPLSSVERAREVPVLLRQRETRAGTKEPIDRDRVREKFARRALGRGQREKPYPGLGGARLGRGARRGGACRGSRARVHS